MGRSVGTYNSTGSTYYKIPHLLLGLAAVIALAGCKDDGGSSADCAKSINKVVSAEVKGSGDLYFNIDDLDFLSSQALVWNTVELNVNLHQNHTKDGDIDLDFNGVKCSKTDGSKSVDDSRYDSFADETRVNYKVHNMMLNGAIPFDLFLRNVKINKGQLRISLHGKDTHITSASITFNGKDHATCSAPSTTPPVASTGPGAPAAPTTSTTSTTTTTVPPAIANAKIVSASPSSALMASTSISIAFSSDISASNFMCSLDSSAATSCSSPIAYSGVSNGGHTFRVVALNSVGQAGPAATYSWTVDSVAPSATITNRSSLPASTNSTSVSFAFSSSESGSTFTCSIDGNAGTSCASPMSYSGLSGGAHSFTVSAIDSLGNSGGPADSFQWTIDVTAPVASIDNVAPGDAVSNVTNRTFAFSANETSTFECSIDHGSFSSCVSPMTISNMADGSHWFSVRATDLVGNVGLASSSSWAIDTVAPSVVIGATNPAAGLSNSKAISVEFATDEPATTYCSLDGVSATCTTPFTAAVTDGSHAFSVYAVDAAGNIGTSQSLSWTIDTTAPVISFGEMIPSGATYLNSNSVTFYVNSNESSTLVVTLNGAAQSQNSNPISFASLADGSYDLSVTAVDASNNASNTITHSFVIDTAAPTVTLTASDTRAFSNSDGNSFTFTSSEAASTFRCQLNGAGFSECSSPMNYAGLADGNQKFEVQAIDLAGNTSTVKSYSWIIDTLPAIATSLTSVPAGYTNQNTANFGFTANRSTSGYLCSLDGGAAVPCASPMTYSGLADGNHTFKVQGIDIYGHIDQAGANYSWAIDRTAPVITGSSRIVGQTTFTLTWTTDEPATSKVNFGLGSGLTSSTADDGVYSTSHSVTISGLSANTIYSYQMAGHDRAGNAYVSTPASVRTSR